MKTLRYGTAGWRAFRARLPRASAPDAALERGVARILGQVQRGGDRALVRLTRQFDGVTLEERGLWMPRQRVRQLAEQAEAELVRALRRTARRIERYHQGQRLRGFELKLPDGSRLAETAAALPSAGLYVPGGAGAYPSSVLMSAIPARVAGVPRLVVATPPSTLERNPAVAAALCVVGLERSVLRVGGAQAIAALAYGTASIEAVAKIVGPGNSWVAAAKRQVRGVVEIDSEAGPSEVAILADDSADAGFVAADLLAQAEHGSGDEVAVLITPSREWAVEVARLVTEGLPSVANRARARRALARHGAVVLVRDLEQGLLALNQLAPEHAQVMARGAARLATRVVAASVFVGPWSPVAVGDYGVGPNHVLPTGGAARTASPLSVRDFQRVSSRVTLTRQGLARVAGDIVEVARAEGFRGHAQSVLTRFAGEDER